MNIRPFTSDYHPFLKNYEGIRGARLLVVSAHPRGPLYLTQVETPSGSVIFLPGSSASLSPPTPPALHSGSVITVLEHHSSTAARVFILFLIFSCLLWVRVLGVFFRVLGSLRFNCTRFSSAKPSPSRRTNADGCVTQSTDLVT